MAASQTRAVLSRLTVANSRPSALKAANITGPWLDLGFANFYTTRKELTDFKDLDGLKIVGLDDFWSGRCDGRAAFDSESARGAQVALCHNPDAVDKDHWPGYQGWILSGHTHGGQCKPPFLPPPLLPVKNRRYTAGEFDLYDGRRLYISRGLGHLLPVRFNCRPEITVFRLVVG